MNENDILRFWNKVDKKGKDDCWNWTAFVDKHGYPRLNIKGKIVKAHQLSAIMHIGPRLPKMCVCHTCDNRKCVNPNHLFYASQADNLKDMHDKGRNRQPKGLNAARSKLDATQVKELRNLASLGWSSRRLGQHYGLSHAVVQKIVNLVSYKDVVGEE
jgi:hypothetical protein